MDTEPGNSMMPGLKTPFALHPAPVALGVLLLLALAACGEDDTTSPPTPPDPGAVASLVVQAPRAQLAKGDAQSLTVVALNADGDTLTGISISWATTDSSVLTIDADGSVTAAGFGSAEAIATVDSVEGRLELTVPQLAFTSLALGDGVSCGLTADGAPWCWGNVGSNGLGGMQGDTVLAGYPRLANDTLRLASLSLRPGGGCGALQSGAAVCWGTNAFGQVGDGTTTDQPVPVRVAGAAGVVKVAAGREHACAVSSAGVVSCWGRNHHGQLGDGGFADRPTAGPVAGIVATDVGVGLRHSCASLVGGEGRCWGSDRVGELGIDRSYSEAAPVLVPGITARHLAAGRTATCAVTLDDVATCWGEWYGYPAGIPIGSGPTPIGVPPSARVAVSASHACAATLGGDVWCLGYYGANSLVDGVSYARNYSPPNAVLTGHSVTSVGVGPRTTCALAGDSAAWCWGFNWQGQAGQGYFTAYEATPSPVVDGRLFESLGVGDGFACGLQFDGTAWCWGNNDDSALGNGINNVSQPRPSPVTDGHVFSSLHVGSALGSCGVKTPGETWCWGQMGEIPGWVHSEHLYPFRLQTDIPFTSLAVSALGSCALDVDGAIWCWGAVESRFSNTPMPTVWDPEHRFVQVVSGGQHFCGLEVGGSVYCWGAGEAGQLGQVRMTDHPTPQLVGRASGITGLHVRETVTCASGLGDATCWGYQQQPGTVSPFQYPDLTRKTFGERFACGLAQEGTSWCWGLNEFGQLGREPYTHGPVGGGTAFNRVEVGSHHACGLATDGAAVCWGRNEFGELGRGTTGDTGPNPTPETVLGLE